MGRKTTFHISQYSATGYLVVVGDFSLIPASLGLGHGLCLSVPKHNRPTRPLAKLKRRVGSAPANIISEQPLCPHYPRSDFVSITRFPLHLHRICFTRILTDALNRHVILHSFSILLNLIHIFPKWESFCV